MASKSKPPEIPLPKSWDTHVKSAILHIIALAQYALTYSRSWAADSTNQRVRLKAGRLQEGPPFPRRLLLPGSRHASGDDRAQVPDLRQRQAVLVPGIQGLVPGERDPAAFRGHRSARLDRRGRELHPDREDRVYSKAPGVAPLHDVPAGAGLVWRLVQPTSAAYDAGGSDARRGLLAPATGQSKPALRASCLLASFCPLCRASGAGQRSAWAPDQAGGELPAPVPASASRRRTPRGTGGTSARPSPAAPGCPSAPTPGATCSRPFSASERTSSQAFDPRHRHFHRVPGAAHHSQSHHRTSSDQRRGRVRRFPDG